MTDLRAIVYVSSASHLLDSAEIDRLLERARERNHERGVSGLLLYCEGNFMQYIEGAHDAITDIFDIIRKDPLHHGIIVLVDEAVESREFSDWSMAFSRVHEAELERLTAAEWRPRESGVGVRPGRGKGRQLLRAFWRRQMRAAF